MRLSIIIPVLNEAAGVQDALMRIAPLRTSGVELIIADGGSHDGTVGKALALADFVIPSPRGRAVQMNAGAQLASGDALLFLHADTRLPAGAPDMILNALQKRAWGRVDISIEGRSPLLRIVAALMNLRSRLTGIATGDQAIFMTREAYTHIGGFPELPLMEDIAMSKALKRLGPPACLRAKVTTSGRRWERHGVLRTIVLMWRLRLAFYLGGNPEKLAIIYGYRPREEDA